MVISEYSVKPQAARAKINFLSENLQKYLHISAKSAITNIMIKSGVYDLI